MQAKSLAADQSLTGSACSCTAIGSDLRRLSVAAKIALPPEGASPSTVTTPCNLDLAVENNSIVRLVLCAVVISVLHI
jgi:hypothetical protein